MKSLFFVMSLAAFVACSSSTATTPGATPDSGAPSGDDDGGTDASIGTTQCSTARNELLTPIASISQGVVSVVSDDGTTKVIYVDASAGGEGNEARYPRTYVDLGAASRVDLTDDAAFTSTAWDLALKRTVIYSNSGDAGPGTGGAVEVDKPFASVTSADATKVAPEVFFDADCNPKTDPIGGPLSAFSAWYNYDQATNLPTPKTGVTYVVRGGTGKLYKVAITSYDATPDGGVRQTTGYFTLQVSAL